MFLLNEKQNILIPLSLSLLFYFLFWHILKSGLLMLCLFRIYVMGQSAGAHIAACTLLEQAIKEAGEGERISWSLSQIKAYFGLSGG